MMHVSRRKFLMGATTAFVASAFSPFDLKALAAYGPEWKTPQDFGALGDGITDDRAAFQAAVDSGSQIYVPYSSSGYVLGSRVRLGDGAVLEFSKKRPNLKLNAEDWLFEIAGSDIELHGISANMQHLTYGGSVLMRTDQNYLERVNISRMKLWRPYAVLHDLPSPTGKYSVYLKLKDTISYQTKGPGVHLQRSFAYQHMEEVHIGYTGSPSPYSAGFTLIGNEGAFWSKCDVTGGAVDATNTNNHAFVIQNGQANWFERCMGDTVGGKAWDISGGAYHYLDQCVSSLVGTIPFSIVSSGRVTLSSCNAGGRAGQPYAPSYPGFYALNSPALILDDGCRAYSNVGGSVSITNCAGYRNNVYTG